MVGLLPSAEAMSSKEKVNLAMLGDVSKSALIEIVSTQNSLPSDAWQF